MADKVAAPTKEAIAKQLMKLIHLIPINSGGIFLSENGKSDTNVAVAVVLDQQRLQTLYLKLYDIAYSALASHGLGENDRVTEAVEIIEIVRNKIDRNE